LKTRIYKHRQFGQWIVCFAEARKIGSWLVMEMWCFDWRTALEFALGKRTSIQPEVKA